MKFYNSLSGIWLFAFAAVYLFVGLVVAIAVYRDANRRQSTFLNLPPIWWAISIGLVSPLIGLGVYWLLHYSSFTNESGAVQKHDD